MKYLEQYRMTVERIVITILCLFVVPFTTFSSFASENELGNKDNSSEVGFKSTIMDIDLNSNLIILAEKRFYLQHTIVEGKKRWITDFLDSNENEISVKVLKPKDLIYIVGKETPSGDIEASLIKLLKSSAATPSEDEAKGGPNSLNETPSSLPQLKDGVWKN
jgi:hypothetical protein